MGKPISEYKVGDRVLQRLYSRPETAASSDYVFLAGDYGTVTIKPAHCSSCADLRGEVNDVVAQVEELREELYWHQKELRRLDPKLAAARERNMGKK